MTDPLEPSRMPGHIAISIGELGEQSVSEALLILKNTVKACFRLGVPMLTFQLHTQAVTPGDVHFWGYLCDDLVRWEFLHVEKIKVSVLGKWYGLSDALVENAKHLLQATKDYDGFFLNLCMNYDGQDEIVDGCRLAAIQVQQGRLDVESINASVIKENLASSAVLPPSVIIMVGGSSSLHGFLLWDCAQARVVFVRKPWVEFTKEDLASALN